MPPSTTTKPPPSSQAAPGPVRGRQPASKPLVTTSTVSTRAKQSTGASTKAAELRTSKTSTSGTLRADSRQTTTKSVKAPVLKASERINTRSVTVLTEERPAAPKAPAPAPAPIPAPKESTDAPTESTEPADPAKEPTNLSESTPHPKPSAAPPLKTPNVDKPAPVTPAPTSDPLQVAAQLYPWLYMTSTLDACFTSAEQTAKKDLETCAHQLSESESELAHQKTRVEAEQAMEFYEALSTDAFARTAPRIMQAFLAHGDACESVEGEALQLALNPAETTEGDEEDGDWDAPLRVYAKMLDTLEQLHAEALDLEASIINLTSSLDPESSDGDANDDNPAEAEPNASGAQTQILRVFKACLPVLRARLANLVMAQELVDGARENASVSLRMESLGLLE